MRAVVGTRGHTIVEVVCASAVLVVIATAALVGGRGHLRHVGRSFDEMACWRAASSRLEELGAGGVVLAPGRSPFRVGGLDGTQEVRTASPGVLEVTVRVGDATLVTRLVRREAPR